MSLTMVLSSLLAGDPFATGKAKLHEAIAGTEVLLVTAVYMLPSLRGRFPVYILKLACNLVCNKVREKVRRLMDPSIF